MARPDIADWLLREGRNAPDMPTLLSELAERVRAGGLPIERMGISYQILHPELAALAFRWDAGGAEVQLIEIDLAMKSSAQYLVSPVRIIYDGGDTVHCRLEGDSPELEYRFLWDLRREGYTDYLVLAVPLTAGRQSPLTMAIKRPGGFTDADIQWLRSFLPTLGLLAEIHAGRRIAAGLLDTYLGHGTGERVLAGDIRRGTVRRIPAALSFCDLRGFTALSERLPRNALIGVLNDYFGAIGRATESHGGEILKFIGDAVLAIFPVTGDDAQQACAGALTAARDAVTGLAGLNQSRESEDRAPLECGFALHVGEVWYGNIGAPGRLDFTVIGPAVNRAARLEKLAAERGETIIVSRDFADAVGGPFESLGHFPLKGIEEPVEALRPLGAA